MRDAPVLPPQVPVRPGLLQPGADVPQRRRRHRPASSLRAAVAALAVVVAGVALAVASPLAAAAMTTTTAQTQAPADADPGQLSWSLSPADNELGAGRANFVYDVTPGQELHDTLVVTNRGAAALQLGVYAADARTTTSGQLDLLPAGETSVDLGTWIQADVTALTLEPGASAQVPFTLRVPSDARPGDHSGGLITSSVGADEGSTVLLDRRLALRVYARVAGEIEPAVRVDDVRVDHDATAVPFGASTVVVRYTLTNTGNARVVPDDAVTVSGLLGQSSGPVGAGDAVEVLPGSSVEREVTLTGFRPLGRIGATVDVLATAVGVGGGASTAAAAQLTVWAVPWSGLALVVLALLAAGWLVLRARRRRTRPAVGIEAATEGEPA